MTKLERIESGFFNLNNSITLDDILQLNSIDKILIPIFEVFKNQLKSFNLNSNIYNKLSNGIKIVNQLNIEENTMLIVENKLVGISGLKDDKILYIKTNLNE